MQLIKTLSAVLAISLGHLGDATPAPSQKLLLEHSEMSISENITTIETRQGGKVDPHKYCIWTPWPLVTSWEVSYPNDNKYNGEKCGHRLYIDVVGFMACMPSMFKCTHLGGDDGQVFIKFNTFFACRGSWVTEAIRSSTDDDVHVGCYPT